MKTYKDLQMINNQNISINEGSSTQVTNTYLINNKMHNV